MDMEEETRRELSALQRERELLQAKEKENIDAIDEVSDAVGCRMFIGSAIELPRSRLYRLDNAPTRATVRP